MANPYESADPFKEASSESHVAPQASYAAEQSAPLPQATEESAEPPVPAPPLDQFYTDGAFPFSGPEPPAPPYTVPMPQSSSTPPAEQMLPTSKFWSIQFYQQFFDVDTRLVLLRVSNTLVPINPPDFLMDRDWRITGEPNVPPQELQESGVTLSRKPDLYGPFWICTTLWMTLGIVSNIISKIAFKHNAANNADATPWKYDFTMVSVACLVTYLYCFGLPCIVWGIMKYKGLPVAILDTICLYGYSMFIFILVAILCTIPVSGVQWAVVLVGGAWSTAFLLINFWNVWKAALSTPWVLGFASIVGSLHMLLTMSFKFYFVNYKY